MEDADMILASCTLLLTAWGMSMLLPRHLREPFMEILAFDRRMDGLQEIVQPFLLIV
jgi:hypothetical protein